MPHPPVEGSIACLLARTVVHASTTLSTICAKVCVLLVNTTILSLGSKMNRMDSDLQEKHLKDGKFNLCWLNFSSSVISIGAFQESLFGEKPFYSPSLCRTKTGTRKVAFTDIVFFMAPTVLLYLDKAFLLFG